MEESRQYRAEKVTNTLTPSAFANLKSKNGLRNKSYQYRPKPSSESRNGIPSKFKCYCCGQKGHKKVDSPKNIFINTKSTFVADKNGLFLATGDQDPKPMINVYEYCVIYYRLLFYSSLGIGKHRNW